MALLKFLHQEDKPVAESQVPANEPGISREEMLSRLPKGVGYSEARFRMALALGPSREEFIKLYGNGEKRTTPRRVIEVYPHLRRHDVMLLATYYGLYRGHMDQLQTATAAPTTHSPALTDESFERLAQRLADRVTEIFMERLLGK